MQTVIIIVFMVAASIELYLAAVKKVNVSNSINQFSASLLLYSLHHIFDPHMNPRVKTIVICTLLIIAATLTLVNKYSKSYSLIIHNINDIEKLNIFVDRAMNQYHLPANSLQITKDILLIRIQFQGVDKTTRKQITRDLNHYIYEHGAVKTYKYIFMFFLTLCCALYLIKMVYT